MNLSHKVLVAASLIGSTLVTNVEACNRGGTYCPTPYAPAPMYPFAPPTVIYTPAPQPAPQQPVTTNASPSPQQDVESLRAIVARQTAFMEELLKRITELEGNQVSPPAESVQGTNGT
jgi:hypothetical protein